LLFLQKLLITTFIIGSSSGSSGGGSVNPNTPQTGIFAHDYPNQVVPNTLQTDFNTEQTNTSQARQLLSEEIDDMQDSNVVGSLQHQIDQLASAAPNTHYHDVPAHTHSVGNHSHPTYQHHHVMTGIGQTGSQVEVPATQFGNTHSAGSATITSGVAQTSGPAGSTAVGHSHGVSDIPHTHGVTVMDHNHAETGGWTGYSYVHGGTNSNSVSATGPAQ
jgi:hypothetical protein